MAAEATFYILPTSSQQDRHRFACKLVEKIYRSGLFCFVLTDSEQQSQQFDDALWTFRPGSFVPHQVAKQEPPDFRQTVLIGHLAIPTEWQSVVVNLSSGSPQDLAQCNRILEILDANESSKQAGRQRFRLYEQAGMTLNTHSM